mmetsp:Transcript_14405/g.34701  ORF Transcript_14405/g.34701 Transcript_14405/m.34701 type:complete len:427 (-) Transcript_14405:1336-2616(-)
MCFQRRRSSGPVPRIWLKSPPGSRMSRLTRITAMAICCRPSLTGVTSSLGENSGVRWAMSTKRPKGRLRLDPITPRDRPRYTPREVAPNARRPKPVMVMRPPSSWPTGRQFSAWVTRLTQPAMNSGCTSTPLDISPFSPRQNSEMAPSSSEPLNSSGGMGSSPTAASPPSVPATDSANPYQNKLNAHTVPASGPAMATSNRSLRFSGRLLICVMAPKDPSWPLGIRYGTDSLILRAAAAIECPASCASPVAHTPPRMGNAPAMYPSALNPSSPGGSAPSGSVVSNPAAPWASQSIVAAGSCDTSATKPSCSADAVVSPNSAVATKYCHALMSGLGPALSLGTMRKLTRGPRSPERSRAADADPPPPSCPGKASGSSSMNTVYLPLKMRSTPSCVLAHTSARSARRLPLTSTPSPITSGPSSSVLVT